MDACNRAGQSFGYRMLTREALEIYEKAIRIGEKIGDFNRLAEASASSSWVFEAEDQPNEALTRSLKALEYSEKTDSDWVRGMTYANLVRQYAWLGDLKHAVEYFDKLAKLPPQVISSFGLVKFGGSRAILFAAENKLAEASQYFEEVLKSTELNPADEIGLRKTYARILNRQKRVKEARMQAEAARRVLEKTIHYYEHAMIRGLLMAPREVELGKDITVRIDLTNVSRKASALTGIERLVPAGFRVTVMPAYCSLQHDSVKIQEKKIEPFQIETIKINLQTTKSGSFNFWPRIVYVDDLGKTQTCEISPVKVTVWSTTPTAKFESLTEDEPAKLEFSSKAAQGAFDYLVSAFMEDYKRQKMPSERSGWRTLMDIAKKGNVSKYSVYGAAGNRGRAISELEHLGLVEARVFSGERGRGGNIVKLRVVCENPTVRKLIETGNK
jgi:tetratricopeptide (TPR) repeat protein